MENKELFDLILAISNKQNDFNLSDWDNMIKYRFKIRGLLSNIKRERILKEIESHRLENEKILLLKSEKDDNGKNKFTELVIKAMAKDEKLKKKKELAELDFTYDEIYKYKEYLDEKINFVKFVIKGEENNFIQ